MDTLPFFRIAIHDAGLEDTVIAVVGKSPLVAANWTTPLAFLFIDGGHGDEPARLDYEGWTPHVAVGGTLAIHDVFPDPADGDGRPTSRSSARRWNRDGSPSCRRPVRYACCVVSTELRPACHTPNWRTTTKRRRSTYSSSTAPNDMIVAAVTPSVPVDPVA